MLNSCHPNRQFEDQVVLGKICFDILAMDYKTRQSSNEFCGVFVDGRNRNMQSYEDYAAFKSIKVFSDYNYPIFAFINEDVLKTNKFLDNDTIEKYRIYTFPIKPIISLDEYTTFCVQKLYSMIPLDFDKGIFFQPDGFLIKNDWENYVLDKKADFIGAKWMHSPGVETFTNKRWENTLNFHTRGCNGGFSYRNINKCREISNKFGKLTLREIGAENNKIPPEDLVFSYFGFGAGIFNNITLKNCDEFCLDPIELEEYENKASFGFHCPKRVNEWKKR